MYLIFFKTFNYFRIIYECSPLLQVNIYLIVACKWIFNDPLIILIFLCCTNYCILLLLINIYWSQNLLMSFLHNLAYFDSFKHHSKRCTLFRFKGNCEFRNDPNDDSLIFVISLLKGQDDSMIINRWLSPNLAELRPYFWIKPIIYFLEFSLEMLLSLFDINWLEFKREVLEVVDHLHLLCHIVDSEFLVFKIKVVYAYLKTKIF